MPLSTHVTDRIDAKRLIELTNPGDRSSTATLNSTLLGFAVADVIADLEIFAGVEYGDTNARHIAAAVRGVVLYLEAYKGDTKAWEKVEAWQKNIDLHLRKVEGNNRILPKSGSKLTPAEESPRGETIRPHFDPHEGIADDLIPGQGDVRDRFRFP